MDAEAEHGREARMFIGRPTVMDVGLGVLYFFTSHMVIRAMYYIGVDRTSYELSVFFLAVIMATVLAHLAFKPLLRLRLFTESLVGIPAVSTIAALGATLALISMLPVIDVTLFYVSGVLLGVSCGWIVVIWTSTIRVDRPDSNSFFLHPSLMVAVACYFLFRCVSTASETITQGFLLALPLIAIVCILQGYKSTTEERVRERNEQAQSLLVLVIVAAAFAIGCSIAVSLSGRDGDQLSSGLNYMVLFEVLAVTLMVFCCWIMNRFSQRSSSISPRSTAILAAGIIYLPMFFIGIMMGGAGIPEASPNALWESNVWVLIIAIFAYDIRESLYAIKGLAVGVMFETMCMGQMIAWVSSLDSLPFAVPVAVCLAALYFSSVCWQLYRTSVPAIKVTQSTLGPRADNVAQVAYASVHLPAPVSVSHDHNQAGSERLSRDVSAEGVEAPELLAYCQALASDYGLTPREGEILVLIAMGRSAKYIAEELTISHNTTRTHVKHIYEKLNIHSKQELLDLVLFGSGLMS